MDIFIRPLVRTNATAEASYDRVWPLALYS